MNKILLIELKDTNALITFTTINNKKWSILLSKEYEYESDNTREIQSDNLASFDLSWIPLMKNDVTKIFPINKIDNIFLIINTFGSLIEVKNYNVKTIEKTNETFKQLIQKEQIENTQLKMLNFKLESKNETPLRKQLKISYEFVNKKILEDIENYLETFGIRIDKIISTKDAIEAALKPYTNRNNNIINIQIEDKFTSFYYIKNNKFVSSLKRNQGLNLIYRKISKQTGLSIDHAKDLFSNFGNIPPEIIIDNRVIFNGKNLKGERLIFTKKDLSKIITFAVNDILKEVIEKIKSKNIFNFEIVFSGKITKLNGFEAYVKDRLNLKNVSTFKTNLIGLNSSTELISIGGLYSIEKIINNSFLKVENGLDLKEFRINRRKKIFSILGDKFNKYYNYV